LGAPTRPQPYRRSAWSRRPHGLLSPVAPPASPFLSGPSRPDRLPHYTSAIAVRSRLQTVPPPLAKVLIPKCAHPPLNRIARWSKVIEVSPGGDGPVEIYLIHLRVADEDQNEIKRTALRQARADVPGRPVKVDLRRHDDEQQSEPMRKQICAATPAKHVTPFGPAGSACPVYAVAGKGGVSNSTRCRSTWPGVEWPREGGSVAVLDADIPVHSIPA